MCYCVFPLFFLFFGKASLSKYCYWSYTYLCFRKEYPPCRSARSDNTLCLRRVFICIPCWQFSWWHTLLFLSGGMCCVTSTHGSSEREYWCKCPLSLVSIVLYNPILLCSHRCMIYCISYLAAQIVSVLYIMPSIKLSIFSQADLAISACTSAL